MKTQEILDKMVGSLVSGINVDVNEIQIHFLNGDILTVNGSELTAHLTYTECVEIKC